MKKTKCTPIGFKGTETYATKKEMLEIVKLYHAAIEMPVMSVAGMGMESFADRAWDELHRRIHAIALKHKLPEIPGHYGLNTKTGEFLASAFKVNH